MKKSKKDVECGPYDIGYVVHQLTAWQIAEDYHTKLFRNLERETLDDAFRKASGRTRCPEEEVDIPVTYDGAEW